MGRFPQELASLPQWVRRRLETAEKGGKDTKSPYNPKTEKKAPSTKYVSAAGAAILPGCQLRYPTFIGKKKQKDLTVPDHPVFQD